MNWTKDDHWGFTNETGVLLKVVNGDFTSSSDSVTSPRGDRGRSRQRRARDAD